MAFKVTSVFIFQGRIVVYGVFVVFHLVTLVVFYADMYLGESQLQSWTFIKSCCQVQCVPSSLSDRAIYVWCKLQYVWLWKNYGTFCRLRRSFIFICSVGNFPMVHSWSVLVSRLDMDGCTRLVGMSFIISSKGGKWHLHTSIGVLVYVYHIFYICVLGRWGNGQSGF